MFPGSKVISHPHMLHINLYEPWKSLIIIKIRREMVSGIVKSCLYVPWIKIHISLPLYHQPFIIGSHHLGFTLEIITGYITWDFHLRLFFLCIDVYPGDMFNFFLFGKTNVSNCKAWLQHCEKCMQRYIHIWSCTLVSIQILWFAIYMQETCNPCPLVVCHIQ